MIEFGKTLRQAREVKGLSIAQIAEMTHMMSQIVEGLEKEDFSRIVAPIYGRGFVKLYCEAVGLEPKELIAEFMEIYTGNRKATIRVREVPQANPPAEDAVVQESPPPSPSPRMTPPTTPDQSVADAPADEPDIFQSPAYAHAHLAPRSNSDDSPDFPAKSETFKSPVRRAFKLPGMSMPDVPPSLWRMATLVAVVIIVLWVAFIGVRALYRATMTAPDPEQTSISTKVEPAEGKPTPSSVETKREQGSKKGNRNPMSIPPLYID